MQSIRSLTLYKLFFFAGRQAKIQSRQKATIAKEQPSHQK
ncbi:hypothetical protein CSB92_4369 [Pseudomonas aeruginosa]|nr:hypothetical protein CSB94_6567 [Pseudomonas aeruginosa]EFQ39570.1 hypothetical protein PA39016_001350037 [Pseudomonas aeruginosa 39016]AVK10645.1 hypothetical protein CSB91_6313 [Pseudomonas aeruginosa]AVK19860.1 hypothetical protein CSB90_5063 [Pseudomonas aeruginosa]AWF60041.1 hypothetical protein CSC30_5433 [Pseudomonas aeruginosa]